MQGFVLLWQNPPSDAVKVPTATSACAAVQNERHVLFQCLVRQSLISSINGTTNVPFYLRHYRPLWTIFLAGEDQQLTNQPNGQAGRQPCLVMQGLEVPEVITRAITQVALSQWHLLLCQTPKPPQCHPCGTCSIVIARVIHLNP